MGEGGSVLWQADYGLPAPPNEAQLFAGANSGWRGTWLAPRSRSASLGGPRADPALVP